MNKIAIYVRVSTDEQDLTSQLESCKKYCEMNNYEIYKIYKDIYTGTSDNRPAFNELLQDMRQYRFSMVVVTKLDRMGRSLKHLLNLFEEFNSKGVQFVAVTQNIDTSTSSGKLQMQILGAFAEFERNLISERTKEGLKGKENVGKRGKDKRPRKRRYVLRKKLGRGS
jgi:DNA invertase Pin-like site-specific DNA recombinase